MKLAVLFLALALYSVCDRPPSPVADHSKHDHSNANHGTMDHSQMESSPLAAQAPPNLQFIDSMIAHHQGAIDMALLADTRSQRAEIKNLATEIIAEQRREIGELQRIRRASFGEAKPAINLDYPGMRTGMTGMDMAKLNALKASEFDVEFVRQMIPHHEGAIEMSKSLTIGEDQRELRELADKIILDQTAEITTMKSWLDNWTATGKK